MPLSALATLTVAEPGWGDLREVRVASVSAAWAVSRVTRLSAFVDARDAWLLGITDWLGLWVRWDHPTMGTWGGVVQDAAYDLGRGTLELGCASFLTLLSKRRTAKEYVQASAPAGALVLRALTDADNEAPLGFDSLSADEDGPLFQVSWRGEDLLRLTQRLASTADAEFDATVDDDGAVAFAFRHRVGQDRRGDVALIEGYQIVDGSLTPSIANLVNDRLAVSADVDWQDAAAAIATDPDSILTYGRRQDTVRYQGYSTGPALYGRAKADLVLASLPVAPASIRVPDTEPQLLDVRQGDTIRVVSASSNALWDFRVVGRSVYAETGVATLVGDATEAS